MTKRDQLERVINHARMYHGFNMFLVCQNGRWQGGYLSDPNSTAARSLPVYKTLDDLLQRMVSFPCSCLQHAAGYDGESLEEVGNERK
jgi:hypothetical protein